DGIRRQLAGKTKAAPANYKILAEARAQEAGARREFDAQQNGIRRADRLLVPRDYAAVLARDFAFGQGVRSRPIQTRDGPTHDRSTRRRPQRSFASALVAVDARAVVSKVH